jgi:predicted nucleic acid-binding protein
VILVDTSVWIDHLHSAEPELVSMLERSEVIAHPLVVEELAMGSIKDRGNLLAAMEDLTGCEVLGHGEVLALVEARSLSGNGLSPVDAHLLGSALLAQGAVAIWTRDKALRAQAKRLGVAHET